jgi:hypothetical protein
MRAVNTRLNNVVRKLQPIADIAAAHLPVAGDMSLPMIVDAQPDPPPPVPGGTAPPQPAPPPQPPPPPVGVPPIPPPGGAPQPPPPVPPPQQPPPVPVQPAPPAPPFNPNDVQLWDVWVSCSRGICQSVEYTLGQTSVSPGIGWTLAPSPYHGMGSDPMLAGNWQQICETLIKAMCPPAPPEGLPPAPPSKPINDYAPIWVCCDTQQAWAVNANDPSPGTLGSPLGKCNSGWIKTASNSSAPPGQPVEMDALLTAMALTQANCPLAPPTPPVGITTQPAPQPTPPAPPGQPTPPPTGDTVVAGGGEDRGGGPVIEAGICPCPATEVAVGAKGPDFCSNIGRLRATLVSIGRKVIIAGNGYDGGQWIDPCEVWSLAHLIFQNEALDSSTVSRMQALFSGVSPCDLLKNYLLCIETYICGDVNDLQAVLAVRSVLESWQRASASWGGTTGSGAGGSIGIGGETFTLGLSATTKASNSENLSFAQSVAIAIVPTLTVVDQVIAYICPTGIIGIEESIRQYVMQRINIDQLQCLIRLNGGRWDLWQPIVESRYARPGIEQAIDLYAHNRIDIVGLNELVTWNGGRMVDFSARIAEKTYILTPEQAVLTSRLAGIPNQQVLTQLAFAGVPFGDQQTAWLASYDRPLSNAEMLFAATRQLQDGDQQADPYSFAEDFRNLYWAYSQELTAQGITYNTAYKQWQLHWHIPDPATLAEWCFRLSAGFAPQGLETNWADYDTLLKSQGYSQWFRDRFKATAYTIPSVRQHANSVAFGQYTIDDVQSALSRGGYLPADAEKLGNAYYFQGLQRAKSNAHGYTIAVVSQLVADGILTSQDADDKLLPIGFTSDQITEAIRVYIDKQKAGNQKRWGLKALNTYAMSALASYDVGAIAAPVAIQALKDAGCPDDSATLLTAAYDLKAKTRVVRSGIAAVRKSLLIGALTWQQAIDALLTMGIANDRASQYATQWSAELTFPRRVATAQQIVGWAAQGILSIPVATARLAALGFDNADILLQVAGIQSKLQKASVAARSARQKQTLAAAKQANAAAKQAKQVISQAQGLVRRFWSIGRTTTLFAERAIDDGVFKQRLAEGGYTEEEITNALALAQVKQKAMDAKVAKHGATGNVVTGTPGQ